MSKNCKKWHCTVGTTFARRESRFARPNRTQASKIFLAGVGVLTHSDNKSVLQESRFMSQTAEPRTKPGQEELGFDPASLKKKYLAERDKRLRTDCNEQYR